MDVDSIERMPDDNEFSKQKFNSLEAAKRYFVGMGVALCRLRLAGNENKTLALTDRPDVLLTYNKDDMVCITVPGQVLLDELFDNQLKDLFSQESLPTVPAEERGVASEEG